MGAFEDFVEAFNAMSFSEKLKMDRNINISGRNLKISSGVSNLYWYGYLSAIDKKAVNAGDGDYFVYVWKHAWGDPFYVGSGQGRRWKEKQSRCDGFYQQLDKADAVTYLLLSGVDAQTARLFERYVSVNLVEAGYTLVNGDNNPGNLAGQARERMIRRCAKTESHELTPAVQNQLFKVLADEPQCDYRITREFLEKYGAGHFSAMHLNSRSKEVIL